MRPIQWCRVAHQNARGGLLSTVHETKAFDQRPNSIALSPLLPVEASCFDGDFLWMGADQAVSTALAIA